MPPLPDQLARWSAAETHVSYGEVSPDGEDHYPVIVRKVFEMGAREPAMTAADVSVVPHRTLVMVGDDDIITLEHTLDLYRAIPCPRWPRSAALRIEPRNE